MFNHLFLICEMVIGKNQRHSACPWPVGIFPFFALMSLCSQLPRSRWGILLLLHSSVRAFVTLFDSYNLKSHASYGLQILSVVPQEKLGDPYSFLFRQIHIFRFIPLIKNSNCDFVSKIFLKVFKIELWYLVYWNNLRNRWCDFLFVKFHKVMTELYPFFDIAIFPTYESHWLGRCFLLY